MGGELPGADGGTGWMAAEDIARSWMGAVSEGEVCSAQNVAIAERWREGATEGTIDIDLTCAGRNGRGAGRAAACCKGE